MVKRNRKSTAGFSLLEFLAVMVLVAVLALIAVPIYDSYIKKARFQNVITAVDSFKTGVAACAQNKGLAAGGSFVGCNGGSNGIPTNLGATGSYISSVSVVNGIITGTAVTASGLQGEIYALNPTMAAGGIVTWALDATSDCNQNGKTLCDNPS